MLGRPHCEDDLEGRVGCVVCHLDDWIGGCFRQREWPVQRPGAGGLPNCLGKAVVREVMGVGQINHGLRTMVRALTFPLSAVGAIAGFWAEERHELAYILIGPLWELH